jgi:hypothetical protein
VTNKDEDYVADCRILIDETALDPIHRIPTDRDLETEIANAIIDGCVARTQGNSTRQYHTRMSPPPPGGDRGCQWIPYQLRRATACRQALTVRL